MADPRCRHFSVKALRHNSINTFRYTNNTSTWTTTLLLPLYIGTSNSPARYALLFPFPHRIPTRSHSATSRTANHTRTSTPPPHTLNKMCQYRVTTFRCGHTRKLPIPPLPPPPGRLQRRARPRRTIQRSRPSLRRHPHDQPAPKHPRLPPAHRPDPSELRVVVRTWECEWR